MEMTGMRTTLVRVAALAPAVAGLAVGSPPAHAWQHDIQIGTQPGLTITRTAFIKQGCSGDFAGSKLNGIDAYVAPAPPVGNHAVAWGAAAAVPPGGYLDVSFLNSACGPVGTNYTSVAPSTFGVTVPPGAAWILVQSGLVPQVGFNVS